MKSILNLDFPAITSIEAESFARLSGDRSPLHIDPKFASMTIYSKNVVHGMLPLCKLIADIRWSGLRAEFPVSLAGRFLAPLSYADSYSYRISSEKEGIWSIEGFKTESEVVFFQGKISTKLQPNAIDKLNHGDCIFKGPILLNEYGIEDIHKGDSEIYDFQPLLNPVNWVTENVEWAFAQNCLMSLSTLVGMRYPGAYGVFQDFNVKLLTGTTHEPFQLKHRIRFISQSVRSILQSAEWVQGSRIVASAEFSATVTKIKQKVSSMITNNPLSQDLQDRVALISGASRGTGSAIAQHLAARGCKVIINYNKNETAAQQVAAQIRSANGQAEIFQADVSSLSDVTELLAFTERKWGRLDFLVNNAAGDFTPIDFRELSWEQIQKEIDITLKGAFYMSQKSAQLMHKSGGGSIVMMLTVATELPPLKQTKYVIAKSGLLGLMRSLSQELASINIRVNAVAPSMMETDFTAHVSPIALAEQKSATSLKRLATVEDVAAAVCFLLSDQSKFMTGQRLFVNGGGQPLA